MFAHSIPESNALAIRTPPGIVLHTGDWKIDRDAADRLENRRGTADRRLAMQACWRSSAIRPMRFARGARLRRPTCAKTLAELVRHRARPRRGDDLRLACRSGFARSPTPRARPIAKWWWSAARWSASSGRPRDRLSRRGVQDFRARESTAICRRTRCWRLCTGSQGEPRAALARIAEDEHPEVTLTRGDRVIFSARTIPATRRRWLASSTVWSRQGVEVITDRTHLVHVSGHPRRAELRDMIGWVRPQILIPAHGEALHLAEHAKLAREGRRSAVLVCRNGDLVRLAPGRRKSSTRSRPAALYKDGALLLGARVGDCGCAPAAQFRRRRHRSAGAQRKGHAGGRSRRSN